MQDAADPFVALGGLANLVIRLTSAANVAATFQTGRIDQNVESPVARAMDRAPTVADLFLVWKWAPLRPA